MKITHPKSPYFIPSSRSPWAVIRKVGNNWQVYSMVYTRKQARAVRRSIACDLSTYRDLPNFRIVRLWVPTFATK